MVTSMHDRAVRNVKKTASVLIFLAMSGLTISGGALVIAATMNVFVAKLDAPSAESLPPSLAKAGAKMEFVHGQKVLYEPVYVLPRTTLSTVMDQALAKSPDPAASFAQRDAVGIGVFLQRQLHSALMSLLHDAVRTQNVQDTPMISVTSGQ